MTLRAVQFEPRVDADMTKLMVFVSRQPWGDWEARVQEIEKGIRDVRAHPTLDDVGIRRRSSGLELRRRNVAQFAIIYAYIAPNATHPEGLVSFRAIRHSRVKDVFRGVRELPVRPYGAAAFPPSKTAA